MLCTDEVLSEELQAKVESEKKSLDNSIVKLKKEKETNQERIDRIKKSLEKDDDEESTPPASAERMQKDITSNENRNKEIEDMIDRKIREYHTWKQDEKNKELKANETEGKKEETTKKKKKEEKLNEAYENSNIDYSIINSFPKFNNTSEYIMAHAYLLRESVRQFIGNVTEKVKSLKSDKAKKKHDNEVLNRQQKIIEAKNKRIETIESLIPRLEDNLKTAEDKSLVKNIASLKELITSNRNELASLKQDIADSKAKIKSIF